jgi:RNA polymerase sigma-70 factor, ECF subfamily
MRCAPYRVVLTARGPDRGKANQKYVDDTSGLVARLRERDVSAFEVLYDRHHRLVFGIAHRILGDPAGAEELVQSVFLKLWSAPDAYRAGNFGAWISRAARNQALDVLRSRSVRAVSEIPADLPLEGAVDDAVLARIEGDRVRDALKSLPDEQRISIELGFFSGVTLEQIAAKLGVPLGTIETRIRSGLRRMRSDLEARVAR